MAVVNSNLTQSLAYLENYTNKKFLSVTYKKRTVPDSIRMGKFFSKIFILFIYPSFRKIIHKLCCDTRLSK